MNCLKIKSKTFAFLINWAWKQKNYNTSKELNVRFFNLIGLSDK